MTCKAPLYPFHFIKTENKVKFHIFQSSNRHVLTKKTFNRRSLNVKSATFSTISFYCFPSFHDKWVKIVKLKTIIQLFNTTKFFNYFKMNISNWIKIVLTNKFPRLLPFTSKIIFFQNSLFSRQIFFKLKNSEKKNYFPKTFLQKFEKMILPKKKFTQIFFFKNQKTTFTKLFFTKNFNKILK